MLYLVMKCYNAVSGDEVLISVSGDEVLSCVATLL